VTTRRYVVVKGRAGLGNRMQVAVAGMLYARVTGRMPIIDWRDSTYSDGQVNAFPQFFKASGCASVEEIPQTASVAPVAWRGHIGGSVTDLREVSKCEDGEAFRAWSSIDLGLEYPESVVVVWDYAHRLQNLKPHFRGRFEPLAARRPGDIVRELLARELTLEPGIRERVDDFRDTWLTTRTVGVHIRRSDRKGDVDATRRELDRLLGADPELTVFLATDNVEVKDSFKVYPNVISTPHWYPPAGESLHQNRACMDRLENGIEALVDLYLVAGSDYLLGDRRSSFFRVAAWLSDADRSTVIDVKDGSPSPRRQVQPGRQ
jgi:Nodulation protein Z (NodZ)